MELNDAQRQELENDVVTLCQELIRIPSVNYGEGKGDERAVAEYVAAKLAEVGIPSKLYESAPNRVSVVARIEGTAFGFDRDSQYNTIVDKGLGQIWFYREVQGIISVKIPIFAQATIRTITDEKGSLIKVGDGSSINITITQTN